MELSILVLFFLMLRDLEFTEYYYSIANISSVRFWAAPGAAFLSQLVPELLVELKALYSIHIIRREYVKLIHIDSIRLYLSSHWVNSSELKIVR